jgi:hypothetical protein
VRIAMHEPVGEDHLRIHVAQFARDLVDRDPMLAHVGDVVDLPALAVLHDEHAVGGQIPEDARHFG